MAKIQCKAQVVSVEKLQEGIFSMWLEVPEIASQAAAGQFISLYCKSEDKLLPRPISLCEIDKEKGQLRLVFRVVGYGTDEFSHMKAREEITVLGPLGNGFPLEEKEAVLIGGGIGIPPMLQLAKELPGKVTVVVGYRDADTFLMKELEEAADQVVVATEDGSLGTKGNVIDAIREQGVKGEILYSCGPTPMLRGVKTLGEEWGVPAWISMEEKMACGIGACLACVCQSKEVDDHSKVHNKRICKDGPVFLAEEIEL